MAATWMPCPTTALSSRCSSSRALPIHKQAYKDVFVITLTKTVAVFVAIAVFYVKGIY
jgi:hypothetical protein